MYQSLQTIAKQTVSYLKKRPFLFGFILVLLSIAMTLILRALTPNQTKIAAIVKPTFTTPIDSVATKKIVAAPIEAPAIYPETPAVLPVYGATSLTLEVDQINALFKLSPTEYVDHYANTELLRTMVFDPSGQRYNYNDSQIVGETDAAYGTVIEEPKAVEAATAFVKNSLLLKDFSANRSEAKYFIKNEGEDAEVTTREKANIIEIPFTVYLQGNPVYIESNALSPLFVYVDSANGVTGFSLYKHLFTVGQPTNVPTISTSQILTKIKSGDAEVAHMYGSDPRQFELNNISNTKIDKITLQYRFITSSQQLVPFFYIFSTVKFSGNIPDLLVEFVLPAVSTSAKQ